MSDVFHPKLAALQDLLRTLKPVLVAFSGGVDSTFLLKVAIDTLGPECFAITCESETMARSEIADARALAQELGLGERHICVDSDELAQPGYAANPINRCAMCKTELMERASPVAQNVGARTVLLGTTVDDLSDHRPGVAKALQLGARSPMVDVGLSKREIRDLSNHLGLRTWDKPQLACLSSRFPYGTEITRERLRQVDELEDTVRSLGFSQVRVRYHNEVARLEIPTTEFERFLRDDVREPIVSRAKSLGFTFVSLDLKGFRSGSLNEGIVSIGKARDSRNLP